LRIRAQRRRKGRARARLRWTPSGASGDVNHSVSRMLALVSTAWILDYGNTNTDGAAVPQSRAVASRNADMVRLAEARTPTDDRHAPGNDAEMARPHVLQRDW